MESYSQGETALLITDCKEDPSRLLGFLDRFIDLADLVEQERDLGEQLLKSDNSIAAAEDKTARLPNLSELLNDALQKLAALKAEKAGELVELEQAVAEGREFRKNVADRLNKVFQSLKSTLEVNTLADTVLASEPPVLTVDRAQLQRIKDAVGAIQLTIDGLAQTWAEAAKGHIRAIKSELEGWQAQETKVAEKIEEKRRDLKKKGIELNPKYIRDLAARAASYRTDISALLEEKRRLSVLRRDRAALVRKRKDCRAQISARRVAWAARISAQLRGTVRGYEISIKFREGRLSPATAELLKELTGWRTSQVPRAHLVTELYTPFELIEIARRKDADALAKVTTATGDQALSRDDIAQLLNLVARPGTVRRLEAIPYEDLPRIRVTKVRMVNGKTEAVTRDFARLSLGQQQAVLLSILLFSTSIVPLIIDQPEDNLDNEFIYRTIVGNLKRVKERRQVIVVTHNANLAVLGDSELIIPLKATSDLAQVVDRGSIDADETRRVTCDILEGSEEAFRRRQEIYRLPAHSRVKGSL